MRLTLPPGKLYRSELFRFMLCLVLIERDVVVLGQLFLHAFHTYHGLRSVSSFPGLLGTCYVAS